MDIISKMEEKKKMLKIFWNRNILGNTPEERKKITGLCITCGYHCYISCRCDCGKKCKYRKNFTGIRNLSVRIHRFFEYRLKIKLPYWISLIKESNDMSGTTMCPYNKPRRHTCYDCKHCAGVDEDFDTICNNEDSINLSKEGRWWKECRIDDETRANCKFFEPVEYADDYNPKTGSVI